MAAKLEWQQELIVLIKCFIDKISKMDGKWQPLLNIKQPGVMPFGTAIALIMLTKNQLLLLLFLKVINKTKRLNAKLITFIAKKDGKKNLCNHGINNNPLF